MPEKTPMPKPSDPCPVETTLGLIGNRWKILIIRDLSTGTRRFGELKRSLTPISQKVLTAKLREMEADGLVQRRVFAEVPPRVEYTLTPLGESLRPVLYALAAWGEEYVATRQNRCENLKTQPLHMKPEP